MKRNVITTLTKIAVSAALLWFLFRGIDADDFLVGLKNVDPTVFVLLVIFFTAIQMLTALRWTTVLRKDMEIRYTRVLSIYFIGMFFNNFLPTVVGGDVIKGYYLYKITGRGGLSFASILMDRYSGFTALVVITSIAVITGYGLIADSVLPLFFLMLIGGYVVASLFIWVEFLHGRLVRLLNRIELYNLNEKIENFYTALMSYKGSHALLVKIFIFSLFIQGGVVIGYYMLGVSMGIEVPLAYYFLFIPLATVVSMVPISLAGLGIREGAFVYLFASAGVTTEQALGLSLVWFAVMVVASLMGGVEYIRAGGRKAMGQGPGRNG